MFHAELNRSDIFSSDSIVLNSSGNDVQNLSSNDRSRTVTVVVSPAAQLQTTSGRRAEIAGPADSSLFAGNSLNTKDLNALYHPLMIRYLITGSQTL